MTAIVGILNKRAAVMAADSAVTVGHDRGVKIYNTATKIFSLSYEQPIGVMIYNDAAFMGTPWDLIFNLYRQERGGNVCQSVQEYAEKFIDFLKEKEFFSSEESMERYLVHEISAYYNLVKGEVFDLLEKEGISVEDENAVRTKVKEVIDRANELCEEAGICKDFVEYTEEEFSNTSKKHIDSQMEAYEEIPLPKDMREEWQHGIFVYLRSKRFFGISTGIVFVGYGEKDIFPSAISTAIGSAIDHRLRYEYVGTNKITHDNAAWILPFAQQDVMITMMKGIHPDLFDAITNKVQESMAEVVRQVTQRLGVSDERAVEVANPIIEETQKGFEENIHEFINDKFVNGLVETVESFNVEDMVNMAESLVSITNLQRHITSSEESVGGPIDVAVITKTGGFQWAKQK